MFSFLNSVAGAIPVLLYSALLMAGSIVLARIGGLVSERLDDWFWWIVGFVFIALLAKYGWAWMFYEPRDYLLSSNRLTEKAAWLHLVVAFWSGLFGVVIGWLGWQFATDGRR